MREGVICVICVIVNDYIVDGARCRGYPDSIPGGRIQPMQRQQNKTNFSCNRGAACITIVIYVLGKEIYTKKKVRLVYR